ncbi:protein kinase [Ophiocordyceps sinensis CO18]|uniref:Protein kinase n=1 Tax=Ophiocordyceps sinensis (strain Co18 / CGMCC 3.14243) TaxID=911162 RepID=T5A320_OPHSC|nr:protein kinase [Ophiocordyceps sinensis CO18]
MTGGGAIKDKLRRASVRNGAKRTQVFIPIGALQHLVELYAAMKHGEEYSFLFPWAAGGPLSSLWGRDSLAWCRDDEVADRSVRTINAVRWLAQQCYGLVSQEGLGFLHNSMAGPPYMHTVAGDGFGIHGNIKPDNVLHFSQEPNEYNAGALKISNTGLIGFNTMNSRSEPSSNAYRAPEHGKRDRHPSCKYDIWSLGCVFSELLSWFILGPDGVKQYNSKRFNDIHLGQHYGKEDHFFHLVLRRPDNAILKPSVSKWMEHLRQTVGEGNFLHDFLTYVEDRMLEVDDGVRVSSKDVSGFLGAKFQMCRDDNHKEYCIARPSNCCSTSRDLGAAIR